MAYPYSIQRVDVLRYFLLHHYGGIYIDLDSERGQGTGSWGGVPPASIAVAACGPWLLVNPAAGRPASPVLHPCAHP